MLPIVSSYQPLGLWGGNSDNLTCGDKAGSAENPLLSIDSGLVVLSADTERHVSSREPRPLWAAGPEHSPAGRPARALGPGPALATAFKSHT